jgi:uncharacterized membrane protein YqjE
MAKNLTPIDIEKASERIRQQRETFNQRKEQDSRWFTLKIIMGFSSIFLLGVIMLFSIYVIANYKEYTSTIVSSVSAALLIDILGLLICVWKIVLNSNPITRLEPIISSDE